MNIGTFDSELSKFEQFPLPITITGKIAWEILEKYNDVTRAAGADEGVHVVDLARKLSKDTKYFYDFWHYNNAGSQKVAEIIFADICPYLSDKFPSFVIKNCPNEIVN